MAEPKTKWHLPLPTGQFPVVGYHDFMTLPNSINEETSEIPSNPGVFLRLLYPGNPENINLQPTTKTESNFPPWYPTEDYKLGMANAVPVGHKRDIIRWVLRQFGGDHRIPILPSIPPVTVNGQKFPVILWSHGVSSCRTTSSHLTYQLASHGFIVAVLEHRDDSAYLTCTPGNNGDMDWIPYKTFGFDEADLPQRMTQIKLRLAEIRETMRLLQTLNLGESINNVVPLDQLPSRDTIQGSHFQGLFDMDNVIVAGHSFGGATAIFALEDQPEVFRIGICLDAWMSIVRYVTLDRLKQPILFVNMDKFQSKTALGRIETIQQANLTARPVYTIKGARHTDVSDLQFLIQTYPNLVVKGLNWMIPLLSDTPPLSTHGAILSLLIEFIKQQLPHLQILKDAKHDLPKDAVIEEGITTGNSNS